MNAFAPALMAVSAAIILLLGLFHLAYTFSGPKLRPRDAELEARMKQVSPGITRQTTMWKAWIGFNASHSYGAIFFGVVYGYLALGQAAFLSRSTFLLAAGALLLAGYVFLGKRYWFSVPFRGIVVAAVAYLGALIGWAL